MTTAMPAGHHDGTAEPLAAHRGALAPVFAANPAAAALQCGPK